MKEKLNHTNLFMNEVSPLVFYFILFFKFRSVLMIKKIILICQNIRSIQERERERESKRREFGHLSLNLQKKLIHLSENEMDFK